MQQVRPNSSSRQARQANVLDDAHDRVSAPGDRGQVSSSAFQSGFHAGHLLGSGTVQIENQVEDQEVELDCGQRPPETTHAQLFCIKVPTASHCSMRPSVTGSQLRVTSVCTCPFQLEIGNLGAKILKGSKKPAGSTRCELQMGSLLIPFLTKDGSKPFSSFEMDDFQH